MNIVTIKGYSYGILDADEFIAQGTTPGAIMSIAEHLSANSHPLLAADLRNTAHSVSHRTGQSLQVPGALTESRRRPRSKVGKPRAHNDNRAHYGQPRNRRAA